MYKSIHIIPTHSAKPHLSLDKTPEFPFWGLNKCVDFDLRDSKKIENINKLNKTIFYNKDIDIYKLA